MAKGATVARVFDTVAALDTWIAVTANKAALNIGDVFLIKAKDVPDYWWDGTAKQELETEKIALVNASASMDGLMSKADFSKLAGIAAGATKVTAPADIGAATATHTHPSTDITGLTIYTHPTTSGNKHIPSGGASGQILRYSEDGTAAWGMENNTTYSVVTASTDGLMSKTDKSRLDAIPTITASATEPINAKTGDLWYDFNNA